MSGEAKTGQLLLFRPVSEMELEPDRRHPWARRSTFRERRDEWRCNLCGELALRGVTTGTWEYLSPERGREQWAKVSHPCVPRVWN